MRLRVVKLARYFQTYPTQKGLGFRVHRRAQGVPEPNYMEQVLAPSTQVGTLWGPQVHTLQQLRPTGGRRSFEMEFLAQMLERSV